MKTRYSRKFYPAVLLLITAISSAQAQWQWSDALQTYTYRDNDGRIHYADGSVGPVTTVAVDSQGRAVYSANSAGPADKTGKYAIQAARIDESSIGPAPTSPPANAVVVKPGSTSGAVSGGTDTSRTTYVNPTISNGGLAEPTTESTKPLSVKCTEQSNYSICQLNGSSTVTNTKSPVQTSNAISGLNGSPYTGINNNSISGQNGTPYTGQVPNAVVIGSPTTTEVRDLAALISQARGASPTSGVVSVVGATTSSSTDSVAIVQTKPLLTTYTSTTNENGGAVFGPSGSGNGLSGPSYRDEYGRVHYADGSVGPATSAWYDNGVWVHATKKLPE